MSFIQVNEELKINSTNERLLGIIQGFCVTEKTDLLSKFSESLVLKVSPAATKSDIQKALENLFGLTVIDVRTLNVSGKSKRFKGRLGATKSWKKAYVRLVEGELSSKLGLI
jgi:large subunit ribosomal protein L23